MYILCDAFVDILEYNRACDELEERMNDKVDVDKSIDKED